MKRNLLFVTYRDGEIDEGLNYALDLAKMTDKGVAVLLVNKKKYAKKFEDIMSAVAFAEENEPETAQLIMKSDEPSYHAAAGDSAAIIRRVDSAGILTNQPSYAITDS